MSHNNVIPARTQADTKRKEWDKTPTQAVTQNTVFASFTTSEPYFILMSAIVVFP